ncbi:unnamed protein product [Cercopithifilaria johnstoni]|uniref:Uncharacterized protein n=1 Tax=Cercopithifilaria johnstoni TaxID=2874296 RepID=A0A8J2MW23_9BILA|nr:unnamed protein product [Cercopithifilaria johnstoni]
MSKAPELRSNSENPSSQSAFRDGFEKGHSEKLILALYLLGNSENVPHAVQQSSLHRMYPCLCYLSSLDNILIFGMAIIKSSLTD